MAEPAFQARPARVIFQPMTRPIQPGAYQDEIDPLGELTPQQRLFVDAYLMDPTSKRRAALAAGTPEGSASVMATKWLRHPIVSACIARAMGAREDRVKLTQDRVLQEVSVMLTARIDDFEIDEHGNVTTAEGVPDYMMAAISRIKKRTRRIFHRDGTEEIIHDIEVALWDKPAVTRLAMTHLGMLTKRISVKDETPDGDAPKDKGEWIFGGRRLILK